MAPSKTQPELVCLISPEADVPGEHPIRTIKWYIDEVLGRMNQHFDAMYAREGRPSIPPERSLKAKVLIALVGQAKAGTYGGGRQRLS